MPRPLVFLILSLPLVGAYAMYASGIVVIYQSSRVVNLAHGAMATVPAYVVYALASHVPIGVAVPVGLLAGAVIGVAIERVFVRRLRPSGSTAQTVGTVAAFGVLVSLVAKVAGPGGLSAPAVFPEGEIAVGSSALRFGQIGLAVVAVVATLALTLLFRRTWFGLAMRGAAVNRRAASLMGVDPDATSTVAWALGGALAALAGILLAAVTVLHPYTLSASVLPAYVAALIGGLQSIPGALVGSAIVGVLVGFVPVLAGVPGFDLVLGQVGGPELTLTVVAMIVMAVRGRRLSSSQDEAGVSVAAGAPDRDVARPARGSLPRPSPRIVLALLVGWVFLPFVPSSVVGDANNALLYALVGSSLVLLTGWIGQISLAQAAFVGVGAFGAIQISSRLGVPFPFTLPLAGALAAGVAAALGAVALRVRGLYLAAATLIFAWMADQYLFASPWLAGAGGSATGRVDPVGYEGGFPFFDFADRRTFYVVGLAATALVLVALSNLRRSKTGRAFFAIRGSEAAAASLGIDVTRYKLLGFALSGFVAGIAGNLVVVDQPTIVPSQFAFTVSLFFLSVAVVGGLRSLGGAVASSVLFAALNEAFFRIDALTGWLDVVSAGLLALVLLFYPGGLARIPDALVPHVHRLLAAMRGPAHERARSDTPPRAEIVLSALRAFGRRLGGELRGMRRELVAAGGVVLSAAEARAPEALRPRVRSFRAQVRGVGSEARDLRDAARSVWRTAAARLERTAPPPPSEPQGGEPLVLAPAVAPDAVVTEERAAGAAIVADGVTVRFGGLTAAEDVTLAVRPGEIVGLIGPNGAGKTTMFNAIAGFASPASGRVLVRDDDVTNESVHRRAARGVGRTFQTMQLSAELTVRDNLLVATHLRNDTTLAAHLVVTARGAAAERAAAARVEEVARTLGLDDLLDRPVAGLPFGTLRMVELARALVTGSSIVLLDEPASGLDEAESVMLAGILRTLRDTLGLTILLIEHDVRLVMSLCDYVYVLDQGRLISEGLPEQVRRDPAVITAYLGD